MARFRRLAALAVALAATVPGSATAAPPGVRVTYTYTDGVEFATYDAAHTFRLSGIALHLDETTRVVDAAGPRIETVRVVVVCLYHASRAGYDPVCAIGDGGPLTSGKPEPETVSLRVRVPTRERAGGWIEANVTFTAVTDHPYAPVYNSQWTESRHVAGPVWMPTAVRSASGRYSYRACAMDGTARTDRTRGGRLPRYASDGYCRIHRVEALWGHAGTDPGVVLRDVRRLLDARR